jgi:hypothetical protein
VSGRGIAILAGAALATAAIALAAGPLLPHPHARPTPRIPAAVPSGPPPVLPLASAAAARALTCPTTRVARNDLGCGTLRLTRHQTRCPTDTRCQVELVGTLRTGTLDVPIALTVTLTHAGSGWGAVEVAS